MCLLTNCISSLEKYLFRLSVHFSVELFFVVIELYELFCMFWKLSPCQSHRL